MCLHAMQVWQVRFHALARARLDEEAALVLPSAVDSWTSDFSIAEDEAGPS